MISNVLCIGKVVYNIIVKEGFRPLVLAEGEIPTVITEENSHQVAFQGFHRKSQKQFSHVAL